ncbi:hypothetical protein [Aquimarina sp. AU474]|uniref:hypothetical protein n=1 Tax=Aquimarina sp. AU474 TaxID=2108529 RepID=UPI000D69D5FF|nr:hypothetical protein [Aquimarina sp. AU474]
MKSVYSKIALSLSIVNCLFSCTEEITVNVAHESQTVIFGELTNLNDEVVVTIQQTLSLNASESFQAVNDALVSLYEKTVDGNINIITSDFSVNQGIYTSNQTVTTTIGNTYWIEVVLNDGTLFKSEEETMLPIVPISEVTVDNEFDDVLNVSFADPTNATNFYKISVLLYNQGQLVSTNFTESNDVIFDGNDNASVEVDLFRFEEENQSIPEYDSREIRLGNINFTSYQFLLNQRAQIDANEEAGEESGGPSQLFSTPPVSLLGNITNTSTNTTALGNFTIISISVENQ